MAVTINLTTSAVCPGGNHLIVTASLGPRSRDILVNIDSLLEPPEPSSVDGFLDVLLKLIARDMGSPTAAQLRTGINGKSVAIAPA